MTCASDATFFLGAGPPSSSSRLRFGAEHFMAQFYSENQLDYELYLWALERHGLQAAYAPLVSQAVAFE